MAPKAYKVNEMLLLSGLMASTTIYKKKQLIINLQSESVISAERQQYRNIIRDGIFIS
jgi:predicted DNA-binding protein (UPF0278 family)